MSRMRVGVIDGLVSAYLLTKAGVDVVLYEKENYLAKTLTVDGIELDLGFMDFFLNQVSCPNMMELFETLGVDMESFDMSFSVSLDEGNGYEWGTRKGLSSLFAQKTNMLNPFFLKMLRELTNFKDDVSRYVEENMHNQDNGHNETLYDFIKSHGYSELFQKAYLVPVCSSFWSCPAEGVMRLSAFSVLSSIRNYHLFQGGPQWFTVRNGSHSYIKKIREELERRGCQIRTGCAVQSVLQLDDGCLVVCEDGSEEKYCGCIINADAPDTLRMLGEQATYEENRILGAFGYVNNDVFLHHDKNLMPRNQTAWSALNFVGTEDNKVCLTYLLNVIQRISENEAPFLVTVNPSRTPKSILLKWSRGQPIPSVAASKALVELNNIQGKRGIWFCGSYQGSGFHEDEQKTGIVAANGILLNKRYDILNNPKQMVPSMMESGARLFLVKVLQDYVTTGTLILLEDGGKMFTFEGTRNKSFLKVTVKIHSPQFYLKIVTKGELGLGEAYMNGDFSVTDKTEGLLNLITIFNINNDLRSHYPTARKSWWTPMFTTPAKYFLHHVSGQTSLTEARKNISSHYESKEVFSLFMDETMTYSCAIFKSEDEDLKSAQMRKISLLIKKARVDKNHHVLDIGCGWGTLAIEIVKQTGCKYTGVNLSENQIKYAEQKVKEAGLQEQIRFLLCDYNQLQRDSFKYDRIITCEAIEQAGDEHYEDFFAFCESVLVEDGIFVLQFISVLDRKYDEIRRTPYFVREYIHPGECMPSLNRLTTAMAASSRLCVEHVENIGTHYQQTIRCWRTNFMKNQSKILALGYNQKFIRSWEYYFYWTEATLKTGTRGDYQVVFTRPGNIKQGDPYKDVVVSAY